MNGKTLLAALCALLLITSCKKNKDNDVSPTAITLKPITVTGQSVKLQWSKLINDSLVSYTIVRVTDTTVGSNNVNNSITYINVDKATTEYTDTLVLNPYAQYYVMANINSINYYNATSIQSNKETYYRTDIDFAALSAANAVYDKTSRQLYIYSSVGNIAVYDLASKKFVRSINANAGIGTCDLGMYNGKLELYVPRNDGWVFIYDAASLTQIDQVNVGGSVSSVINNNGNLFITATTTTSEPHIVVCNRAIKTFITQQNINSLSDSYLGLVPNTNSEFYGIDDIADLVHLKFDAQGNNILVNTSYVVGSVVDFYSPVVVFPDASNIICSSSGIIIDSAMKTATTLPHGNLLYTSFSIDGAGKMIYAATNNKSILAYSIGNYQLAKTYNTIGSPVKIFYDNGTVVSVSLSATPSYYNISPAVYTFVEQF